MLTLFTECKVRLIVLIPPVCIIYSFAMQYTELSGDYMEKIQAITDSNVKINVLVL